MKLLIKQRVFSWTDTYDIYDEAGKVKYFVKAELMSLGHRLHVYDQFGQEIGSVSYTHLKKQLRPWWKERKFSSLTAMDVRKFIFRKKKQMRFRKKWLLPEM